MAGSRTTPSPKRSRFLVAVASSCVVGLLVTGWSAPGALSAQELRGRVIAEGGGDQPVEGAVVTLLDRADTTVGAAFTNQFGTFSIAADSAGDYRVRIDRIGFQRWHSEFIRLDPLAPRIVEFELPILPVRLADLDVSVHKQCVDDPREAREVELVWDEARKALESQVLAQTLQLYRFNSVVFDRRLNPRGTDILGVKTSAAQGLARAPFRSLEAERLSADGYIQQEGDVVYYYAPDATVLLSDTFRADHCFGLDREERDGVVRVGLTFEPHEGRRLPDISGVLWLREATNALDLVEFKYENIPFRRVDDDRIAGRVEYGRLPTGAFIVRDWHIRMPVLVHDERRDRYQIGGFTEYGGELRDVSEPEGGEIDWRVGGGVQGTIINALTGAPLRDATLILDVPRGDDETRHTGPDGEFFFDELRPGKHKLELSHSLFSTIDVRPPRVEFELTEGERLEVDFGLPTPESVLADLCGDDTDGTALIVGRVRDRESGFPLARARVRGQWTELPVSAEPGENYGRSVVESGDARADLGGRYALCDVPVGLDIVLQVEAPGGRTGARSLRVARLVNLVDFVLDPPPVGR